MKGKAVRMNFAQNSTQRRADSQASGKENMNEPKTIEREARGAGSASLDRHLTDLHNLGNDLEEWCDIRVRKDMIPKGATLVEAYQTEREIVVMGQPQEDDENHNCDAMGCGTLSHVLYRLPLPNDRTERQPADTDCRRSQ